MRFLTVSLNGPDNVGKTSLIDLLEGQHGVQIFSGIQNYDDDFKMIVDSSKYSDWWFNLSTNEEHIKAIHSAIMSRWSKSEIRAKDNESGTHLFDRGAVMFEAVCTATIATKNNCSLPEARIIFAETTRRLGLTFPREDVRILLKHGSNLEESVALTLSRENESTPNQVYEQYQGYLQAELEHQESEGKYTHVILVGQKSIVSVYNEIVERINEILEGQNIEAKLSLILPNLESALIFSGMSECGKSSLAEAVSTQLPLCRRLKIGFLLEHSGRGKSVYKLSPRTQGRILVQALDDYLKYHHWIKIVTLESAHNTESMLAFQNYLGPDIVSIIFIEADFETRQKRSLVSLEDLIANDKQKQSHGINSMKPHANLVVDNGHDTTFDVAKEKIFNFVREKHQNISIQSKKDSAKPPDAYFSDNFVLSAGSILVSRRNHPDGPKVAVLYRDGAYLLPKGRKNIGEDLIETAVRETYEETGLKCKLMTNVRMQTRATPNNVNKEHLPDKPRWIQDDHSSAVEPFAISTRPLKNNGLKVMYWYLTEMLDDDQEVEPDTQMEGENFQTKILHFPDAIQLMTVSDQREVCRKAYQIVLDSNSIKK